MIKKLIIFSILFIVALSITTGQEANALTRGFGQYGKTTASLDPSKVCGLRICHPGENAKWSSAIKNSQREGPEKAAGATYGQVIMKQIVVNSKFKDSNMVAVQKTSTLKESYSNLAQANKTKNENSTINSGMNIVNDTGSSTNSTRTNMP